MAIPNADFAFIPSDKLTGYLMDANHPVGGAKARWFESIGYRLDAPHQLAADMLDLVRTSSDFIVENTKFGVKYEVNGQLKTPTGVNANVITILIQETGTLKPRLVTAVPGRKAR